MKTTSEESIVIIGAGPAGLLLAHYLSSRKEEDGSPKYTVTIYERRPDPRKLSLKEQRTFPITLQERGRKALRGIEGLEGTVVKCGILTGGSVMHSKKSARARDRKKKLLALDRNNFVLQLLHSLTERFPSDLCSIHFDSTCTHIDFDKKIVTVQDKNNNDETFTTQYDRLVGADGARSCVRDQLSAHCNDFECEQAYIPDAYKTIFLAKTTPEKNKCLKPDYIHATVVGTECRVIVAPVLGDDVLHGAFVFDPVDSPVNHLTTKEQILDYFQKNMPTLHEFLSEEEAEALASRPKSRTITVKCNRFHNGDSVILLGDAAHSVSASIGQGCNSALQDVAIFDGLLDEYHDDWSEALAQFSVRRVEDCHALKELSDNSMPRKSKYLLATFFARRFVQRKLHDVFPRWFQPTLFDMIMDTDMPYGEILRLNKTWIDRVKRASADSPRPMISTVQAVVAGSAAVLFAGIYAWSRRRALELS